MAASTTAIQKSIWDRRWLPWLVFGVLTAVYLVNRSPYVGFNDGLSFVYAAEKGFDLGTNATSHFLYINLLHVLVQLFSFLPTVLVGTLFSVGCSVATLYLVYRMARRLSPERPQVALLPVALLGMAFTFWQQTEVIEVYAFNNLIFVGYASLALHDLQGGRRANYLLVSLLLGIGWITHIQHILATPFFIAYLWGRNALSTKQKVLGMLPWMGLMSILFILPRFTGMNTWQDVFFESKFGNELLGLDWRALLKGLGIGLALLGYCFHLGLVPMLIGWRLLWRKHKPWLGWLLLLLIPWLAFAIKYSVNDNHVFYLIPYILLVLPSGLAWEKWLDTGRRGPNLWMPMALLVPALLYATTTLLATNIPALQRYDEAKAYKGGVVHLLWPGKMWAKNPLAIALEEAHFCRHSPANHIEEWNFEAAKACLKARCAKGNDATVEGQGGWTVQYQLKTMPPKCFFDCPDLPKLNPNSENGCPN